MALCLFSKPAMLHVHTRASTMGFSYFLDIKEDTIVYDGIVLMKDESGLWSKIFNKLFRSKNYSKETERVRGVCAMLPDYTKELKRGNSLSQLITQISSVRDRQILHLSGFLPVYSRKSAAHRICAEVCTYCGQGFL